MCVCVCVCVCFRTRGASVVKLVARWTKDHYHHFRISISEGCFIFDFASLPLEVARPICLPCAKTWS